jgi:2'-5' RNA ligase
VLRTIGVAIGIPEPWGSQLDECRAESGEPMATLIPSHLTLLGPTEVDDAPTVAAKIDEHLRSVASAHRPFQLHLRGTGTFRPVTQVVFIAVAAGIAECELLASDIRSGLLARELSYPYHPHVTVAHDVPTEALDQVFERMATFEARFPVDGFTRYEHGDDGRWHPRRRFNLDQG